MVLYVNLRIEFETNEGQRAPLSLSVSYKQVRVTSSKVRRARTTSSPLRHEITESCLQPERLFYKRYLMPRELDHFAFYYMYYEKYIYIFARQISIH